MKIDKNCKFSYQLYIHNNEGIRSGRPITCCQKRDGLFLKSWRCVGPDSEKCPGHEIKEMK
jgi:hypothetical protein